MCHFDSTRRPDCEQDSPELFRGTPEGAAVPPLSIPSQPDHALQKTFAHWLNQTKSNLAVPLAPEDLLEAVFGGIQRVAATLNGASGETLRLPDEDLKRALQARGIAHAVTVGLEIPFAGAPLKERIDHYFHPSRFGTRRVGNLTRLEITISADFLDAIMAGAIAPEGMEITTEMMKSCLGTWITRYAFHTLEHQRQGITAANYQDHAGTSRLHADFEADLRSLIYTAHAFGLEVGTNGTSPNPSLIALMSRLRCCTAFAVRQRLRDPASAEEIRDRRARSVAGRISLQLIRNNLAPISVIVGEATTHGVPVIINNHAHQMIKGTLDRDQIAEAALAHYRAHLDGCATCRALTAAHMTATIEGLESM